MPPTTATGRRSSRSSTLLRLAAAGLLAIAVATCSDDHMGGPSRGGAGYFGFRPVTHLSGPPASFGIVIDSVHIRLTRLPSTVVLDTTAFFPADSSNLKLALLVSLSQQTDTLEALIELKAGPNIVFSGTQSVVIVNGPPGSSPPPAVNLAFVGPGKGITHITVAPKDTAIALGDSARYSAAADSAGSPVTQFYVGWKTSDTTLAKMNATGLLRAPNHRGTLKVIGTTPTGIADTTTVFFVPVATALVKTAGDNQTGTVGTAPGLPLTVQAKALDNLGVAGVAVHFSVISGGGSVTDSLVLTDSLGHASTPVLLGTGAGKQLFLARAGALAPDTFTVTAAAGAPSAIAINGGNAQSDTTSFALPLPLAAKVTDAFGNAVSGAKVAWLKVAGGGAVANDTTVTDTAGVAKVIYTLGGLARTDTVSATLAGTGAKVSFTATGITAAAANIVLANGNGQTDTIGKALPQPLVVFVSDARAHLVAGARVIWTAAHGGGSFAPDTVFTDTTGHAQTSYTMGTLAGTDSLVATAPCACSTTFTATALAGAPAAVAIQSGNAQIDTINTALPLPLVVKATDAFGNVVNGATVNWVRLAGGGIVSAASSITAATGLTQITYTLGSAPRLDSIKATLGAGPASVTFAATTVPPAPTAIALASGNIQTATVGTALTLPLGVTVTGAGAKPVAGTKVAFSVKTGTGTFGGPAVDTVTTDTLGHAQAPFTLGTVAGVDSIQAHTVVGGFNAVFAATATAAAPSGIIAQAGNAQIDTIALSLPLPFTAKVTDSFGNPVAGVKVLWTKVAGGGTFSVDSSFTAATGLAQTSYSFGFTPHVDSVHATIGGTGTFALFIATSVAPAPAVIVIAGGSAQSDTVGKTLSLPLAVTVTGAGVKPVAGTKVAFSIKTGTGSFGGASVDTVATDTLGHAQVSFTLGTVAGIDSVQAKTVVGGLTVTFGEAILGGAPSAIAIVSGNPQSDTVLKAVPLPFIVKVTDAFANPIAGAKVVWSIHTGGGTFAPSDTAVTAVNGQAAIAYTLPAAAGLDSLRATIVGTPAFVNFTATGTAGLASGVTVVSGNAQSDTVAKALPLPLVVRIADASNNPVAGTKVFWTRVFGSGTVSADSNVTDAAGHAQITFTLGALVGTDSIKAALSGGANVVFTAAGTADAPAAVAATGGTGQSGSTGTVLPNPLVVKVTDSHGNAVSGVPVVWAVTGGGGSIAGVTSVTDGTGSASVAQWTLGGLSGSNTVTATVTGAAGSPVTFTAVALPLGTTKTWTGSAGTTWATAGSWSPVGIPISTDNVFIPSTAPAPSLAASASVGGLQLEAGAHLTLNAGDTLTTLGTVLVPAGATVTGTGAVTLNGTTQQVSGAIANLTVTNTAQLTAATVVSGNVSISGSGSLAINGKSLGVGGAFTVSGSGQLVMTNAADSVDVAGTFTTSSGTSATGLTAGVLVVRGGFDQASGSSNNFAASGAHTTVFAGAGAQTASFNNPGPGTSHFANVTFANAAGVTFSTDFAAIGTVTATGNVNGAAHSAILGGGLADATSSHWHVDTTSFVGSGAFALPDSISGVVAFTGTGVSLTKALKVNGAMVLGAGSFAPNGHALTVAGTSPLGSLSISGSATLVMSNAADSVDVAGPFAAAGASSAGTLTAGKLVLRNAFAQIANSSLDFAPSGTHRTIFAGTTPQAIIFANPGAGTSHFQDVTFANPAGVVFASDAAVTGTATVSAGQITGPIRTVTIGTGLVDAGFGWHPDTTVLSNSSAVFPDSMTGSVHLQGTDTLAHPFKAKGQLTIDGSGVLTLNGHALTTDSALTVSGSGLLRMTTALDSVDVGGLFTATSATSSGGSLTAGTLVVRGGFVQLANSSNDFAASGTHRTIFAGGAAQTLAFANPGTGTSHFQDVIFQNAAGVTLSTPMVATGSATILAGSVHGTGRSATIGADLVDAANDRWLVDTTLFTGSPALPDSFSGVIHFQGTVSLTKALKVVGSTFVDNSGILTPSGHPLTVTGAFTTAGGGRFVMTNAADSVDITGPYSAASATSSSGDLTAGTLVLRSSFTQVSNSALDFAASGTHRTIFVGGAAQTITFANPTTGSSHFQDLLIDNPAGVSLASAGVATGSVTVRRGTVTGALHGFTVGASLTDTSNVSWRPDTTYLTGTPVTLPDSIQSAVHVQGTTTLSKALKVKGLVSVEGSGILQGSGHALTITGALSLTGGSRLVMSGVTDSVDVGGAFTAASSTPSGTDLAAGTLVLRGNFTQVTNSSLDFVASGTHRTIFAGGAAQTLSFANPASSHFQDVEFANAAGISALTSFAAAGSATALAGNVTGAGRAATIASTLIDASNTRWQIDTTIFSGTPASLPDSIHSTVHFQGAVTLAKALRISGGAFVDGGSNTLVVGGHTLSVVGALQLASGGQLAMKSAGDSVDVGGLRIATTVTGVGLDTTGVLVVRGGFHQTGGTATGFSPSGSHLTRIVTGSVDSVSFFNPGFSGGSHFNNVEITAGAGTIILASDVEAVGTITKAPGTAPTLRGISSLLRANGLSIDGLVLDSLRLVKSGTAQIARFDSVTFQHDDPTFTQFTLSEAGAAVQQVFTGVSFTTTPTGIGRYLLVADSASNGLPVTIGMDHSFPLGGQSLTSIVAGGDGASVNWSILVFLPGPQNDTTGVILTPAIHAVAMGPIGDTITTFTDTVTMAIGTNPVGGVLTGTLKRTAVAGVATFNDLVIAGVGNGYTLTATTPQLPTVTTAPFNIGLVIPPGTSAIWTGATDSLWTKAANWQSGLLPDSASNVFIPITLHNPYLGTSGFVHLNRLVIAAGAGFKADTFSTVQVDSSLDNSAIVTGGGIIQLARAGTVRGIFNTVAVTGNFSVVPGSSLLANRDLTVSGVGAKLDLNGTNSATNGSLTVTSGALLVMTHAGDTLSVTEDASFSGGNELGFLTAGRILLQGNFSQFGSSQTGPSPTAFAATAGHVTELLRGSGIQTVHFANPDTLASHFGSLVLSGADSVVFDTLTIALGNVSVTGTNAAVQSHDTLAVAGNVTTAAGSRLWLAGLGVAGTLNVLGAYHVGTTGFVGAGQAIPALSYDTVRVVGSATLGANATAQRVYIGGGGPAAQFDLGAHTLTVNGDFTVDSAGVLVMTNPNDTLAVNGNFSTAGRSTYGTLTNGAIDLGGGFTQANGASLASFAATGAHTVRFLSGQHSWGFATPDTGAAGSHFANLVVLSGGTATDTAHSPTIVSGNLTLTGGTLVDSMFLFTESGAVDYPVIVAGNVNADATSNLGLLLLEVGGTIVAPSSPAQYAVQTTMFTGAGQTIPVLPYQSVAVSGTASAGADLTISTNLTIEDAGAAHGTFDPAGHTVTIVGTLTTYDHGALLMTQPADSVDVGSGGSFVGANFGGGSEAGRLTAGTLVIQGNFKQTQRPFALTPTNDSAFFATGSHRTIFTGSRGNNLQYATLATQFNKLDITGAGGASISPVNTVPFVVADSLQIRQGALFDGGRERVVALGPVVADSQSLLFVDTLEVYSTLSVPVDTNFGVQVVRFFGTNQAIPSNLSYLNVDIVGTAHPTARFEAQDTLNIIGGQFDVNGQLVIADSAFSTLAAGTLKMTDPADSVLVFGPATFAGGSTAGLLTAGVLQTPLFHQMNTNSAESFAASGSHRLDIVNNVNNTGEQIDFQSSGGAGASHAQNMSLSGFTTILLNSNLFVGDTLVYEVSDGIVNGAGAKVTVMGPYVQAAFNNFNVDTLELHDSTAILNPSNGSVWAPGVTIFAGTNQLIRDTISYRNVEITGSAHLGFFASADAVTVNGGTLDLRGNLATNGDFSTVNGGVLQMTTGGNNNLFIGGNATFGGGSTSGTLTAGEIRVGGNFTELATSTLTDFAPLGTKVTLNSGSGQQLVRFARPGTSYFRDLDVLNSAGIIAQGLVQVLGNYTSNQSINGDTLVVQGTLTDSNSIAAPQITLRALMLGGPVITNSGSFYNVARTHIIGSIPVPSLPYNDLVINAPVSAFPSGLSIGNLYVAGPGAPLYEGSAPAASLTLSPGTFLSATLLDVQQGSFTVGGGNVDLAGNLQVGLSGALVMNQAADSIFVGGDAIFQGNPTAGQMSDGTLIVGGSLAQFGDPQAFAPSGNHLTEFVGPNPGVGATHDIIFTNPSTSGFANLREDYPDTLLISGGGQANVAGLLTVTQGVSVPGLVIRGAAAGTSMSFGGSDIHSAVFDTVAATFTDAQPLIAFDGVTFNSPTDNFTQFAASGPAGDTVTISNITFTTIGAGNGLYVQATNTSGSGTFTVQAFGSNENQLEFLAHVLGDVFSLINWLLPS